MKAQWCYLQERRCHNFFILTTLTSLTAQKRSFGQALKLVFDFSPNSWPKNQLSNHLVVPCLPAESTKLSSCLLIKTQSSDIPWHDKHLPVGTNRALSPENSESYLASVHWRGKREAPDCPTSPRLQNALRHPFSGLLFPTETMHSICILHSGYATRLFKKAEHYSLCQCWEFYYKNLQLGNKSQVYYFFWIRFNNLVQKSKKQAKEATSPFVSTPAFKL